MKEDEKDNDKDKEKNEDSPNQVKMMGRIKICCLTWNMHGLVPTEDQVQKLLKRHSNCDIYAIGSEECLRSIFKSLFNSDKSEWEKKLQSYFGEDYVLIASEALCAIHLVIFVRSTLIKNISKVKTNYIKTGVKNLFGNKGAVGISFNVFNISIMIINCHLAALQGRSEQRNIDFERCVTQMDPNYQNFDLIILMGDLNYRLNNLNIDMDLIQQEPLKFLSYDQLVLYLSYPKRTSFFKYLNFFILPFMHSEDKILKNEINLKRINLLGFIEGEIYFRPTFKYWNNTSNFQYYINLTNFPSFLQNFAFS